MKLTSKSEHKLKTSISRPRYTGNLIEKGTYIPMLLRQGAGNTLEIFLSILPVIHLLIDPYIIQTAMIYLR